MLIVALVLAVIGLTALVTAVVTSNEVVAWVCIAASALGVILLVVDAIRERQTRRTGYLQAAGSDESQQFTEYVDDRTEVVAADGQTEVIEKVAQVDTDGEVEPAEEAVDENTSDETAEDGPPDEIVQDGPPDEIVHDQPEYDTYSDDEPEYPQSAEEAAMHTVDESELDPEKTDER